MSHPTLLTAALDDRYVIERELGAGGMAVVYLARDRKLESRLGIIPRAVESLSVSQDGTRFVANTADYRADAWMSKVIRP